MGYIYILLLSVLGVSSADITPYESSIDTFKESKTTEFISEYRPSPRKLEKIKLDKKIAKIAKNSPKKELIIPEMDLQLAYPEMDFSKIIKNNRKYDKEYLKSSNVEITQCENVYPLIPCDKIVRISCYMSDFNRPIGLEIYNTKISARENINSHIRKDTLHVEKSTPQHIKDFEFFGPISIKMIQVGGIWVQELKLSHNLGFSTFIPGKKHNFIIRTQIDPPPCVQEIIDSIEFLDK